MSGREDNIEDRIIGDVESNTGDDFSNDTTNTDNGDVGDGNSSAEPTQRNEQTASEASDRLRAERGKQKDGKTDPKGKKDQQQPKRDDKGNIVDNQGNVVASRGVERRLHYERDRLKDHNKSLSSQVAQLQQQLQSTQALGGLPKQYGLESSDVPEAMRIAGVMKRDPVGGARMALEYALSQGADLNQIVTAQNLQNISLGAQRRMLEEFNAPNRQRQQQEAQQRQSQESVQRFLANHLDAQPHLPDIAKMVPEIINRARTEGRNLDPYTAGEMALRYLQNFAMQNRLDPNRPIQEQIEELNSASNQQQSRNGGQQQNNRDVRPNSPRQQAPMPNGSRGGRMSPSRSGSLPAGTSSDAIVRQAMLDNGYNFGR